MNTALVVSAIAVSIVLVISLLARRARRELVPIVDALRQCREEIESMSLETARHRFEATLGDFELVEDPAKPPEGVPPSIASLFERYSRVNSRGGPYLDRTLLRQHPRFPNQLIVGRDIESEITVERGGGESLLVVDPFSPPFERYPSVFHFLLIQACSNRRW